MISVIETKQMISVIKTNVLITWFETANEQYKYLQP